MQCRLQLSHHNREIQNGGNLCSIFNRHCVPKSVLLRTIKFTNFLKFDGTLSTCVSFSALIGTDKYFILVTGFQDK